ncbi:MAG: MlaD family protein [Solirubrobacteraceae bacterium]
MTRRRALLVVMLLVVAVVVVVGRDGGGSDRYRFSAVFDTAQGIVPGQLVKLGGARVGTVRSVDLTPDHKARFGLEIESRFGPFHEDASCKILPEGFISESFIQCDPGSPSRPALGPARGSGTAEPTVPLQRTSASVQLQQVLDTFALPTTERVRTIMIEMGIASAGRADDFDALLRRANPALRHTRDMLTVLADQRQAMGRAVEQTDRVLEVLAGRDGDVRRFVRSAESVARNAGDRDVDLRRSVRRLPALLAEADSSLRSLERLGTDLTPTVRALGRSAPQLNRLTRVVPPLAAQVRPALDHADRAFGALRRAVGPATGLVGTLDTAARESKEPVKHLAELLESSRSTGALDGVGQRVFYGLSVSTAAYDAVSHTGNMMLGVHLRCILAPAQPGCSQRFDSPQGGQIPLNDPAYKASEARARRMLADPKKHVDDLPPTVRHRLRKTLDHLLK